jgi:hypothetical protein
MSGNIVTSQALTSTVASLRQQQPRREDIMAKQDPKAEGRNVRLNPGDEAPPGTPGTAEAVCRDCGGTGRIGASTCPKCGGGGKVIKVIGGA